MARVPEVEHVLFVVNNYPPSVGGVQQHVASLARHLVEMGHGATVVTLAENDSVAVENGVRVIRRRRLWGFGSVMAFPRPTLARSLVALLGSEGVTVVSTHTRFFPMTWLGDRVARLLGVPRIHTEHGSDFVRGVSLPIGFASRIIDLTRGRATLRRANAVIGVSPDVVTFVEKLAGVSAEVFFNAIEPPPPAPRQTRSSRSARRWVFVGRLVPGKGWDLTARVARTVSDATGERVHVDFLGDGPERRTLETLSERLGIDATVHGRVSHNRVMDLLAGSVLVNPSTLAEGFQTSLLEALAVGAAVVTSPVPGAQILQDDGAPVVIVAGESAEAWAHAIDRVETLRAYPSTRLAKWLWPHRAVEYVDVIHRVRNHRR